MKTMRCKNHEADLMHVYCGKNMVGDTLCSCGSVFVEVVVATDNSIKPEEQNETTPQHNP